MSPPDHPHIPVELMFRTPDEVQRLLDANDFFLREVIKKDKLFIRLS